MPEWVVEERRSSAVAGLASPLQAIVGQAQTPSFQKETFPKLKAAGWDLESAVTRMRRGEREMGAVVEGMTDPDDKCDSLHDRPH